MRWFPLTQLPEHMIPYPAAGIHAYRNGIPFSTLGWGHPTPQPTSPPTQPLIPITTAWPRRTSGAGGERGAHEVDVVGRPL
jgi:hypothetical protein